MANLLVILGGYGVIRGLYVFCVNKRHLLKSLLRLEFISLMVYWLLSRMIVSLVCEQISVLFYLVMVVREGVLGLSLLVLTCHGYGRDTLKRMRLRVC